MLVHCVKCGGGLPASGEADTVYSVRVIRTGVLEVQVADSTPTPTPIPDLLTWHKKDVERRQTVSLVLLPPQHPEQGGRPVAATTCGGAALVNIAGQSLITVIDLPFSLSLILTATQPPSTLATLLSLHPPSPDPRGRGARAAVSQCLNMSVDAVEILPGH
ncbi:hypothetical protein BaRGS_00030267 [Batillaria attramentaria]|uniref:Uncharacterized protein n=1 Tax=Batillaria attramentaria TaxID=370345 RepID=A0ABD0JUI4_9CAEN